jgi:bacillithiol synthase
VRRQSDGERVDPEIIAAPLSGSRLVQDYRAAERGVRGFYDGNPWSLAAFRRKVEEVGARFDGVRRKAMADSIEPTSEGARRRLDAIVGGSGFFVTTGQQAGLFGGPLFTVYKALSAIRLAATLEEALGVPVAALFWIGSEDHDWAEVDHSFVLDARHRLRRIVVDAPAQPASSMARRGLGPGVEPALDQLAGLLPDSEAAASLIALLRRAYRPDRTVAAAFRVLLREWFAGFDLLLTDAAQPGLKQASLSVLRAEVESAAEAHDAVAKQSARLQAAGYRLPVPVLPGAANLMYEDETGRERLMWGPSGWTVRGGSRRWTTAELLRELDAEPRRFSPNVLLRPIVESTVFPTLCYVAGPSELAYFGQLACLFRLHGLTMPLVRPRASLTLVEAKVRRTLDQLGLAPDALGAPAHELASRLARDALPAATSRALGHLRSALQDGYHELSQAAAAVDPTLDGPLGSTLAASLRQLGHAEATLLRHWKRRHQAELGRLERARRELFPADQPQERVLGLVHYLAYHGPSLLDALASAIDAEVGDQRDWGAAHCG